MAYECGDCATKKERFCPSKRKKDCGEINTHQTNCETRPCPLWSEWSYKNIDAERKSLCWNEHSNKQHFCYTNKKLRDRNHPSQLGTRTKHRDCQGKRENIL